MKYEWRKQEKKVYGAKREPAFIHVPLQQFIMLDGKGNPNDVDFSERVGALYSLAYAIKMGYKAAAISSEISDFTVYPLEGVWKQMEGEALIKEKLEYTIMIRQPDFITKEMVYLAVEQVKIKKPNPFYKEIRYDTVQAGKYVEILHIGAFDEEPYSFDKMDKFTKENGRKRIADYHREIYLNNANRTEKSKLKTILRYLVD